MEGKMFRVDIPHTSLCAKTYKEATEIAEVLFKLGVQNVDIQSFRPSERDC